VLKSECRNPKFETNPKSEAQKPLGVICLSSFVLVSDFDIRISNFRMVYPRG